MQAKDVMTRNVVTVAPDAPVTLVARMLIKRRISAVPVVDAKGQLAGIVSEGDLMRRPDAGTGSGRHGSWWLDLIASSEERMQQFAKAHGQRAGDVMTRKVVTVSERAPLDEIAALLEKHRIKRVPVMRGAKLVGIVSRANLLQGLAARSRARRASAKDPQLRARVLAAIRSSGAPSPFIDVVVSGGVAHLWGGAYSEDEKAAIRAAAASTPGIKAVRDNLGLISPNARALMWAE